MDNEEQWLEAMEQMQARIAHLEGLADKHIPKEPKRPEWFLMAAFVIVTLVLLVFSYGPTLLTVLFGAEFSESSESTIQSVGSQILPIWAGIVGVITGRQMNEKKPHGG